VLSVQSSPNGLAIARLAMIVPKRHLPRAVDRNRTKRLLREWFRLNQQRLGGRDLLFRIVRPVENYETLVQEVNVLFPTPP
jgi:ribonuclease P protein component